MVNPVHLPLDSNLEKNQRGNDLENGVSIVPVQVIFCLKEKNKGKINSHRCSSMHSVQFWSLMFVYFSMLALVPGPTSICHLWKAFDANKNVGGACGEITVLKGQVTGF